MKDMIRITDYSVDEIQEIFSIAEALLNPCPPFYRGEEVAADAIDSEYFVGYEFKKALLEVQQAVIVYCLMQ